MFKFFYLPCFISGPGIPCSYCEICFANLDFIILGLVLVFPSSIIFYSILRSNEGRSCFTAGPRPIQYGIFIWSKHNKRFNVRRNLVVPLSATGMDGHHPLGGLIRPLTGLFLSCGVSRHPPLNRVTPSKGAGLVADYSTHDGPFWATWYQQQM